MKNEAVVTRARVAQDADEYMAHYLRDALDDIDDDAKKAMDDGTLERLALSFWVRRMTVLAFRYRIDRDIRQGVIVRGKKDPMEKSA